MRRRLLALPLALLLALAGGGTSFAHEGPHSDDTSVEDSGPTGDDDGQHPAPGGHLPGSSKNVDLVGKLAVSGAVGGSAGHIADVAVKGNHAYLAARRLNTSPCGPGGFYTVDISNPASPRELSFTAFPTGSYPGEGMHVLSVNTPSFRGDVLIANNEVCSQPGVGGVSLYDVTDPTNVRPLSVGFGDRTPTTGSRAHAVHSAVGWTDGRRAFVMMTDNEEIADVDIVEITDPASPRLIKETGILDWPDAHNPLANGDTVFLHDMVVRNVGGRYLGLLSYWDAGWVVLDLSDPANPVFVRDSDYVDPEPLLGESPPEGNAHQGEWSHNAKYILGTDEDFSPTRTKFQVTEGPGAGFYGAGQFGWTVPIDSLPDKTFAGRTVWGGSGCEEDVNGNGVSDRAEVPPKSTTGADVVVFIRGACFFSKKVESGQLAGYDKVIVMQSHAGTRNGLFRDGYSCGSAGHVFPITASAICIGHRAGHLLFSDTPEYSSTPEGSDLPAIGTLGAPVKATTAFDGWGGIHLLDGKTLAEVDQYAIPEALDPAFQTGFGNLTVHEVAMDPAEDLGYLSWYAGGLRVMKFGADGLQEVGHYIDEEGNDFWGVEAHRLPADASETTYVLASDRDTGLWIFRYTGN